MIFPTLKNKKVGYVNLNLESEEWMLARKTGRREKNQLLDPLTCQKMVHDVHKKYDIDFSYGGWMEDRSFLWKGSYLEKEGTFIHLGVDFNVPPGTDIALDFDVQVVKIDNDYPEDGGWGPRVIARHLAEPLYFIFAHLDRNIKCAQGDRLKKGEVFAKVGEAPYNGNWFPHLHVQTISLDYYNQLQETDTWQELDGYGSADEIELNARRFRDPMKFLSL